LVEINVFLESYIITLYSILRKKYGSSTNQTPFLNYFKSEIKIKKSYDHLQYRSLHFIFTPTMISTLLSI
jgi:hypothetical protein